MTNLTLQAIASAIHNGNEEAARTQLQDCNDAYYTSGTSQLTDSEFDTLHKAYTARFGLPLKTAPRMNPATPVKKDKVSAVKTKGRTDRHANVAHDWPLLSGWLAKASSLDDYDAWCNQRGSGTQIASPKWDGLSVVITYDRTGNVVRALTRGDDGLGVDVTRVFAGENHFQNFDFGEDIPQFGVKYEVAMSWSALEQMNESTGGDYKNPRNTVPGIIGSDTPGDKRQYLTLIPLDITWNGCVETRLERITLIFTLFTEGGTEGFEGTVFTGNGDTITPFYWMTIGDDADSEFTRDAAYAYVDTMRTPDDTSDNYMIDGIVFEYVEDEDIKRLGGQANDCPDYSIAVKFPSMVGTTVVTSIDFDTGVTGRRTPVVNYTPITLDGRTFSRSSIANMIRFDALKLCVGTPIIVEIRGDVIGWVTRAGADPAGAVPIECPEGLEFTYNAQGHRVFAFSVAPLEGRCERMIVKMGIKGVKIETFKKLVDAGLITTLGDCFRLDENQVATVSGMGETSAELVCSTIEAKLASGFWDWEILASVGIANIGRTLAKSALKVVSLDDLIATAQGEPDSQLLNTCRSALIAELGPERGPVILDGVRTFIDDITDLASLVDVKSSREALTSVSADTPKYKVVVTGDLKHWEDRNDFKDYIESLGHKMVGSISAKTDLLITNDPNSGTVKNKRARDLNVRIATEQEAINIMGLTAPPIKGVLGGVVPSDSVVDLDDF